MTIRPTRKMVAGSEVFTNAFRQVVPAQPLPSWLRSDWFLGLILVLAVLFVYQPVWYAGFVWDDDYHLTANPCIVGPLGLKEIWTTNPGHFFPLVFTLFWLEHALWGLTPLPYHVMNVAQQAMCAILLWRVLRSLQIPGAWLGAALWTLHPVQVESVAWISEMKNTQSGLFYLLTILFYVKMVRAGDAARQSGLSWNYGLSLFFAALAMLSKPSTLVLPVVLGLCAWWVEGQWSWRQITRLVLLFFLSIAAFVITSWPRTSDVQTLADPQWARSWPQRVATSGDVVWFYLGKLIWPHPLIAIYPRWQIDAGQWTSYLPLLAVILVLIVLWLNLKTWSRPWFFAFAYFLVVLSPFLGLIDQSFWRFSFVEDHLQYLACMGPLALMGAGLIRASDYVSVGKSWLQSGLSAGILLVLGIVSWHRNWAYESPETLWNDTLAKNPACWMAQNNLGFVLFKTGELDEAMAHYQQSLEINPNNDEAHNNLGVVLLQKGQMNEALIHFQRALTINPNYAEAHYDLGNALLQKGQVDDAITEYQKALAINPNFTQTRYNLGNALSQKGRVDEAIEQYEKVLQTNPNFAEAHNNLGISFARSGRMDEALVQFQKALAINPGFAQAYYDLGNAFLQKGQVNEAIAQFQEALHLKPDFISAQNSLTKAQAMAHPTPPK